MAQPLPAQSIVQVTIETRVDGQTCLNVLHYQTGSVSAPDYVTAMQFLNSFIEGGGAIGGKLLACQSVDAERRSVTSQPIYPTRLAPITTSSIANGTFAGDALPPNVATVVEKASDFGARWGRGSLHIAGISKDAVAGGTILSTLGLAMNALGDQIKLSFLAGIVTYFPVIWNFGNPARVTPITRCITKQTTRVMRRRTVGVGI